MKFTYDSRWRSSVSSSSPSAPTTLRPSSTSLSSFLFFRLLLSLLLPLLLPGISSFDVAAEFLSSDSQDAVVEAALQDADAAAAASAIAVPPQARPAVGTKYAPVDGQDGKPHMGAFVEVPSSGSEGPNGAGADGVDGTGSSSDGDGKSPTDASAAESTSLKRLSEEMASKDGLVDGMPVPIPESNDGVMDDKNRVGPKQGTTGTEGGVSGKGSSSLEAKVPHAPKEASELAGGAEEIKVIGMDAEGNEGGIAPGEQHKGIGGLEVRYFLVILILSDSGANMRTETYRFARKTPRYSTSCIARIIERRG